MKTYHADNAQFLGQLHTQSTNDWVAMRVRSEFVRDQMEFGHCLDAPEVLPAGSAGMAPRKGGVTHVWIDR